MPFFCAITKSNPGKGHYKHHLKESREAHNGSWTATLALEHLQYYIYSKTKENYHELKQHQRNKKYQVHPGFANLACTVAQ